MRSMMSGHDIPFADDHLRAVSLAEVYKRLCGNLINIYSHSRNVPKMRVLLDLLLSIEPNNYEFRLRHAQASPRP